MGARSQMSGTNYFETSKNPSGWLEMGRIDRHVCCGSFRPGNIKAKIKNPFVVEFANWKVKRTSKYLLEGHDLNWSKRHDCQSCITDLVPIPDEHAWLIDMIESDY